MICNEIKPFNIFSINEDFKVIANMIVDVISLYVGRYFQIKLTLLTENKIRYTVVAV